MNSPLNTIKQTIVFEQLFESLFRQSGRIAKSLLLQKTIVLFLIFNFQCSILHSQQYPVQISTQLIPPYSLTLSDYYATATERLIVLLTNTDLTKPNLNVQLRMTVEGQGLRLRTRQGAYTPMWNLQAGIPMRITTADLTAYFAPDNLDAQEWPPALRTQGKLPEGFYKFCFEAFETGTNKQVGRSTCAMAWISLSDPPILNLPNKGEGVAPHAGIANIVFQWTPRHMNSPNAAYSIEYEFSLHELWDHQMAPEAAISYAPVIYQQTTTATTLLYGPAEPQLMEGKRYAWRIKAQARQGMEQRDVFRNNGYSETGWFLFQSSCVAPLSVKVEPRSQSAIFSWTAANLTDQRYMLQYREAGQDKWYSVEALSLTPQVRQGVNNLKAGTAYEYRVGTHCPFVMNQEGAYTYTSLQRFETLQTQTPDPNCGVFTPDIKITNRTPLATLNNGDIIMAGDFPVKLLYVHGNTLLSGTGYVTIPVLANSRAKVTFTNIQVNSDKQLIAGFIETSYDHSGGQTGNINDLIEGGNDNGKVKDGLTHADYEVDFSIGENTTFHYDSVKHTITISDGDALYELPLDTNEGSTPFTPQHTSPPVTVKDRDGHIYKLEQDPDNPEKLTATHIGTAETPIPEGAVNFTRLDSDQAIVRFEKGKGTYAFDQWMPAYKDILLIRDKYEQLEGGYYVPWKLLPPGKTDEVTAVIELKDSRINPEKVIFKTPKGTVFNAVYKDNTYTIYLTGGDAGDAQELYALYPDGANYLNLGKLSIASYTEQRYKLVVVQVNDKLTDTRALSTELNNIYAPIGISWDVSVDDFNYGDTSKFFAQQSGLLSAYNGSMKTFQATYAAQRGIDPEASYLFVLRYSGAENVKNRDAAGFMPRGKQFGYLFTTGFGSEQALYTAAAHELAHGRFQLRHTFDNAYGKYMLQGATDNLMDYADNGRHLAKWQWDLLFDPGVVIRLFESDEDGMALVDYCNTYAAFSRENLDQTSPASQYPTLPRDMESLIAYIETGKLWTASDIDKNIQVVKEKLMADYFIFYDAPRSVYRFDYSTWAKAKVTKDSDVSKLQREKTKDQIAGMYICAQWDDLFFESAKQIKCDAFDKTTSAENKKQYIAALCNHFTGTCFLTENEKFKWKDGTYHDFPDARMYYNLKSGKYEMDRFKTDLRLYINTQRNSLVGVDSENASQLQYIQESWFSRYAEFMSKAGASQIEGISTAQQQSVQKEFRDVWRKSNPMGYYWEWNTLKDERLEKERQEYIARLKGEQALSGYLEALEAGRIGAWVDIGVGSGGLVLTGVLLVSSEITLGTSTVVSFASAAFSIDQISGGVRTLQALDKGLFDPNKEYKVVKGIIIDEFGDNAGVFYDLASLGIGGRSAWDDITKIKGKDIEGILRALNAKVSTYNIGNTVIEFKK